MKHTTWFLGSVFGTLSVVLLIEHGFEVTFVSSLQVLLDFYETSMKAVFDWATPLIDDELAQVRDWSGWDLHLHPHWKHVFVLMFIYFGAGARTYFQQGWGVASFSTLWGFVVAVLTSITAGTVSFKGVDASSNFLVGAIPVVGVTAYDLGRYSFDHVVLKRAEGGWSRLYSNAFGARVFRTFLRGSVALSVIFIGVQIPFFAQMPSAGLVLLSIIIVAFATYWLAVGATISTFDRKPGVSWWQRFRALPSTNVGLGMFGTICGATFFIATNAGLRLLDL